MTRYLLFSIAVYLAFLNHSTAQQPAYWYGFKLIGPNGKFITDADSLFSISSIRPDGTVYKFIDYRNPSSSIITPGSGSWRVYEYYKDIREFHLIQILNKESKDTMTFFYKKLYKHKTYTQAENSPVLDTIRFIKGYYIVKTRPLFKNWNTEGKFNKVIQSLSPTDFQNYITKDSSVIRFNNDWLFSKFYLETGPPAPLDLSRFTGLIQPIYHGVKPGKIVVFFIVGSDGRPTDVIPSIVGTTLGDEDLSQKCKEAVMKSRLLQSDKPIQYGTIVFNFN